MDIHTNIPLKNYLTMRLGGNARFMTDIHTPDEIPDLVSRAKSQQLPVFILGGGSNTLVRDEGFPGVVLRNRIMGFEVIAETASDATLKIGAGENWDDIVKRVVDMKLAGIECLSAIPGTAGAAPVQNIGAYGQEIAETLVSVDVYDMQSGQFATLTNEECHFAYRSSIFREADTGRYIITSITLRLYKAAPHPPFYKAVQDYLDQNGITIYTVDTIRQAVSAIRADKLPDPTQRPNTGSFFKNAVVEDWQLVDIRQNYPDAPIYEMGGDTYKLSTGWLIEQAGLKGALLHGIRVHDRNALVLINESATNYADLAAARDEIAGAVRDKFRIQIVQEPLEMPS
ncbi:MAG: UDP-N-acetylmuramate dehydrogenase [Candidatus Saccharimonas sp.]